MATSTYVFDNNDTLIKIANIFNTSVRALVKLNPWLKDSNGKTYLKPKDAVVTQYLDDNFFLESREAYNLLLSNGNFTITLSTAPKNLKVEITHNDNRKEFLSLGYDNRFYSDNTGVCQENLSKFSFATLSFLIPNYDYAKTIVQMKITYNLMYIIIPVVGNGASSTEDYLLNLNDIIGLQYNTTVSNFISNNLWSTNNSAYSEYSVHNLDRYTTDLINDAIGNSGISYDQLGAYGFDQTEFLNNMHFSESYSIADLSKTELSRLIETAIYSASPNTRDKSDFSGKMNRGLYEPIRHNTVVGNAFYSKCRVMVGKTVLNMPCFPDSVEDGAEANYSTQEILGRSEPFLVYNNTSGRRLSFTFVMHREMTGNEAEIETIVKVLESGVYPQYGSDIAPQKVTVIIGNQIYITGVMLSERTTWSGPIDINKDKNTNVPADKYNMVSVTFTVAESTNNPKSASDIATMGGYRNS